MFDNHNIKNIKFFSKNGGIFSKYKLFIYIKNKKHIKMNTKFNIDLDEIDKIFDKVFAPLEEIKETLTKTNEALQRIAERQEKQDNNNINS